MHTCSFFLYITPNYRFASRYAFHSHPSHPLTFSFYLNVTSQTKEYSSCDSLGSKYKDFKVFKTSVVLA